MPNSAIPSLRTIATFDTGKTSLRTIFLSFPLSSLSFSLCLDFRFKDKTLLLENENCSILVVELTDGSTGMNGFVAVEIYGIREIVFTDEQPSLAPR